MRTWREFYFLAVFAAISGFHRASAAAEEKGLGAKALYYMGSGQVTPVDTPRLKPNVDPPIKLSKTRVKTSSRIETPQRAPSPTSLAIGIHYWLETYDGQRVSDSHVFRTGDRIRMHLRSNADGYLTLWSLDADGKGHMLFPAPNQTEKNLVRANVDYVTPGMIKFTPPVQDERLLVFFSRQENDHPVPTATAAPRLIASLTQKAGSRALVFETEEREPEQIGGYVVNKDGGPVAKEIRLKHQPR